MKSYLQGFLKEFEYLPEDAETLLAAYERILLHKGASELWDRAIEVYQSNYHCDYKALISTADEAAELVDVNEFTAELLLFICLSKHLRVLYAEHGIDMEFYHTSMLDLRYKLDECKLVYGIVGSFVADWFKGFFDLTRFGIGRLQFEVIPFGASYEKDGNRLTPESPALNVHIPRSGEPLTPAACDDSFRRAKAFFAAEVGDPCPFTCRSWLLNPDHEDFLPKHTNTYQFFKRFDIYKSIVKKERGDLWRLFDTKELNCDKLPADSSLRRAYVEHLKKGGKMRSGHGVFFL